MNMLILWGDGFLSFHKVSPLICLVFELKLNMSGQSHTHYKHNLHQHAQHGPHPLRVFIVVLQELHCLPRCLHDYFGVFVEKHLYTKFCLDQLMCQ